MNPVSQQVLIVFGTLFAVVMVILALPYLSPYSGSASTGLVSAGTEYTNVLPFIGLIIVGGAALLAMQGRSR